jgi:hypothetical protein
MSFEPDDEELEQRLIQGGKSDSLSPLDITKMQQDPSLIPAPVEGASLGYEGDAQPASVTGIGGGVGGDSILESAVAGFNRGLGLIVGDPILYNAAIALRNFAKATGIGGEDLANIKPDKNMFSRVFASGDFETQEAMSSVLGIPIQYGQGEDIGVTDQQGLLKQAAYGAGKFAGEAVPFAGGTALLANQAAKGLTATGALNPTYGVQAEGVGKTMSSVYAPKVAPMEGGVMANVGDDMLRFAATKPATSAGLEAGVSGVAGAVTETSGSPEAGMLAVVTPAFIPQVAKYMPFPTAVRWTKKFFEGGDLKDVALGTKGATEGKQGQIALNKAQKMIQEQLNLTPEESAAALARFEEIRAVIPEFSNLPIGQVYDNPALIATFQDAVAGAPNEQIPALNKALEELVSGVTKFKETIGIDSGVRDDVITDAPLILQTAEGSINLKAQKEIDKIGAEDIEQEKLVRTRFEPEKREKGLAFQKSLEARKRQAEKKIEEKKIKLGIVETSRRQKLSKEKTESGKGFKKETIQRVVEANAPTEDVLRLQKRVNEELVPRQGEEAYTFDELPQPIQKLVRWDSSKTFSFDDYLNARKAVSNEINKAIKQGSGQQIPLGRLRTLFDDWAVGAFEKVGKNYVEFLGILKRDLYDPFEKSLITQITAKDGGKGYLTQSENAAKTLINKDPEVLEAFVNTVKREATEVDEIKAVLLDNMYESAYLKNKGVWDADKLNLWMKNNRDRLKLLPGEGGTFLDEMNVTQKALNKSLQRRKAATDRKEKIEKSLLGRFFKSQEQRGLQDPEQDFLSRLINKPTREGKGRNAQNTMLRVKNDFLASSEAKAMGKKDAENVFRRTIFEKLDEEQGIMGDPAKFKAWLQKDKNTQLLKDAGFSETHMKDIFLLADASERISTIPILEMKGLSRSGIIERLATALGTSTAAVSTRVLAVKENRISPRTAFIYLASRAIGAQNKIRMDALMREAIQDPSLAKALVTELPEGEVGRIPGPIIRRVNNYLVGSGVEAGEEIKEEMNRGRPLITLPEQRFDVEPNSGATIETTPRNVPAPPPPSMDFTQVAPPPNPAPTGGGQVKVSSLFPFDPLSAAIQERQQKQGQGIGSLMG